MKELELYIHIPFCMKKCRYCDFLSAPADESTQNAYVKALLKEIAFYGERLADRTVSTVYIGGGTPSWLQEQYTAAILEKVRQSFSVEKNAEISIECNPGTLTKGKLLTYKSVGINRLSIGLQSADNNELKLLGRIHTYEQFLRNYELARECGFSNINIDLMNALPRQTVESYYQTLTKVIRLAPEHISSYSLIIEKGTPFYDDYKFDMVKREAGMETEELPNEDTEYQIGKMSEDVLTGSGYEHYEISNFAKRGYACRHNIGYWQRTNYLGLGLGAASLIDEVRYSNIRSIDAYLKKADKLSWKKDRQAFFASDLHEEITPLSKNEGMEEFMFLGLRMTAGVEKNRFYQSFGFTPDGVYREVIAELKKEKLLEESPTRLWLTERGMDLSNYVLAQFLF